MSKTRYLIIMTASALALPVFGVAMLATEPACTPAERANAESDINSALTAEQVACLVTEHYVPTKDEAAISLACNVSQAIGSTVLTALRLADARATDAGSVGGDR